MRGSVELATSPPARRPSRCHAHRSRRRRSRRRRTTWRSAAGAPSCRCRSPRGRRHCCRGRSGRRGRARAARCAAARRPAGARARARARRTGQRCARVISTPPIACDRVVDRVARLQAAIQSIVPSHARRDAHPVRDRRGLGHLAQDRSGFDPVADGGKRRERASAARARAWQAPCPASSSVSPAPESRRSMPSKTPPRSPGPSSAAQRVARARHGVSGPEPTRVRVHLNGGESPRRGRSPRRAGGRGPTSTRSSMAGVRDSSTSTTGPLTRRTVPGAHRQSSSQLVAQRRRSRDRRGPAACSRPRSSLSGRSRPPSPGGSSSTSASGPS